MIWRVRIDQTLIEAFVHAGSPDQAVIDTHLARLGKARQPIRHGDAKRWYYLLRSNPRVRLLTVGRPLDQWVGKEAKIIVGAVKIIGEFPGNRALVGKRGLQLKCEPIESLIGNADLELANGEALLNEISEQLLDSKAIERSQRQIRRRYEWK